MAELFRRYPEVHDIAPASRSDFIFPRLFGTIKAPAMLADLAPVARGWSPDLVVSDTAEFAGRLIAAKLGIPAVSHAFCGLLPEPRVAATGAAVERLWKEAASTRGPTPH